MREVIHVADDGQKLFECPGCKCLHGVYTQDHPNPANGMFWKWNESMTSPTFTPSILVRWLTADKIVDSICHSFVTDGQIQFLSDCSHELAGQNVAIPEFDS